MFITHRHIRKDEAELHHPWQQMHDESLQCPNCFTPGETVTGTH